VKTWIFFGFAVALFYARVRTPHSSALFGPLEVACYPTAAVLCVLAWREWRAAR
jgi:hypothetical protein